MISALIRRLIGLLFRFGIYKHHYTIKYSGDKVSTNKFYATPHWSVRSKLKNEYVTIFTILLQKENVKKMSKMSLVVFCNTRLDIDNHIQNKFLVDSMKGTYLPDDTTKCYLSTHTIHDGSLPKGHIEYHILGV